MGGAAAGHPAAVLPGRLLLPGHRLDDGARVQSRTSHGPYDTLGDADPYAHQVDVRWQHTASPYGPVYLLIAQGVVNVAGQNVIAGTLLQRLVELVGVALIVWALPRLARICGFDPVAALWLGALNPLVLFHLIGGGHNEALMLGAMLAGMVIAWEWSLVGGVVLITLGVGVKATAGDGAGVPGDHAGAAGRRPMAGPVALRAAGGRRRYRHLRGVHRAGRGGFRLGGRAGRARAPCARSCRSPPASASIAGQSGLLLGLGDHTQAVLDVMQPVGTLIGSAIAVVIMWQCWQRRINPIMGLGMAMGAFVLLAPVIQPWYLLWAALPLAASTADAADPHRDRLADRAVLGDDHAQRRDHPGVRHRAGGDRGGGGRGRRVLRAAAGGVARLARRYRRAGPR